MNIVSATITGSLILNGVNISSVTGSESSINALNSFTASAATTGSNQFNGNQTVTGSVNITGSLIVTGSIIGTVTTASYVLNAVSASYALVATTASYALVAATSSFADIFTVAGTLTAQKLVVQTITSSIVYSSGSNIFGNSISDTQSMTGSVGISGSLAVVGAATFSSSVTGVQGVFSASSGTYAGGSLILKSSTGTNPIYLTSNGGFFALSNGGGGDHLLIESTGAATFSGAVTATTGTTGTAIKLSGVTNYGLIQDANSVSRIWFENTGSYRTIFDLPSSGTSFVFRDYSGNIGASISSAGAATFAGKISTSHSTSGDYAAVFYNTSATGEGVTVRGGSTSSHNAFIVQPYNGATTLFSILATGAATFSSSVTANIITSTSSGSSQLFLKSTGGGSNRDWQFQTSETAAGDLSIMQSTTAGGATYATKLNITSAGNVGIGTTSPNGPLDVVGPTYGGLYTLSLIDSAAVAADIGGGIYFGGNYTGTTKTGWAGILGRKDNATDGQYGGYMVFQTRTHGSSPAERMRITSGGNVGIGTTSPTNCKLAIQADWVSGNSTVKAYPITSFASSGLAGYGIFDSDGTTRKAYFSANSTNVEVWGQANAPMVFATNDTERMRITSGGNVGIGTTNPLGKLTTFGGAVQFIGDYDNHHTIIKSTGNQGTFDGSLVITIPAMSTASADGYGGFSCEVYVAGYNGMYCHVWFSGYINGGITASEAAILRSNGGWSVSQASSGTNNQGFTFTIDYPNSLIHPTARIIFNKGGNLSATAYPANSITAVWS